MANFVKPEGNWIPTLAFIAIAALLTAVVSYYANKALKQFDENRGK